MLRTLSAMFVVLGLLFAVPQPVQAQIQAKAYAPENLRTLSYNDQVRVISLEYSEQSRGRRIPDDQLRFYIDQVNRSNWGFSRIKQDIATSLGGGGWDPEPLPGPGGSVVCESRKNRRQECRTHFRGSAQLVENISQTRCIEGQNWGSGNGVVWVSRGCKARFVEDSYGGGGGGNMIRCESQDGRQRTCATPWSQRSRVSRQLSATACVEGRNWGSQRNSVWVSGGCRAEFTSAGGGGGWWPPGQGGGNNYTVTCSSANGRRSTCPWNNRYGYPALIQQLSSDSCQEGYSWGYQGNQIWVDRGCRARFGVR
ncbi:MAG TPA: DUF3011 domain-containing protein [Pseudoxanthomonas sp.]